MNNFPVAARQEHVVGAAMGAHSMSELIELRRQMLRFARSLPRGPERNNRRQIASSLRSLFRNKVWLDAHTTTEMIPMQKFFFDMFRCGTRSERSSVPTLRRSLTAKSLPSTGATKASATTKTLRYLWSIR